MDDSDDISSVSDVSSILSSDSSSSDDKDDDDGFLELDFEGINESASIRAEKFLEICFEQINQILGNGRYNLTINYESRRNIEESFKRVRKSCCDYYQTIA